MAVSTSSSSGGSHVFIWLSLVISHIVLADPVSIRLNLSSTLPDGIFGPVSPSFAGFGIEPSNLFSFMGFESPNPLTTNLLANLANYTGAPAHIRIGGNTQDMMIYEESMMDWACANNPEPKGQGAFKSDSMLIGPRFFEAANRLPAGTPVTWGLNLAYKEPDYVARLVKMASMTLDRTPNINITAFEIGNEPDLYGKNGFRDSGAWSGSAYVKEWQDRAATLWTHVLSPRNLSARYFEAAATASTIGTDFQVMNLVTYNIGSPPLDSGAGAGTSSFLAAWNQHDYYYYIGVSTTDISISRLLQLQSTEEQFVAWATQVRQARDTPYPYALREMGIVGPIGLEGITDVFATALWTLNFLLYAASLGVESVQLHMTDNSNASAWQPTDMYSRKPFVRPVYYGVAAFDQVIGGNDARVWQYPVGDLSLPAEYEGYVRAYVVYSSDALASIVIVNGRVSNVSVAEAEKPLLNVQLNLPSSLAGQLIHLAYLTGPGADATKKTTWNGISYEASGDGTPIRVSNRDDIVKVGSDGSVIFSVRDTQAVVGTLGRKAGAVPAGTDTSNGGSGGGNTTTITTTPVKQPTASSSSAAASFPSSAAPATTFQSGAVMLEVSLALVIGAMML